jgi:hypothetical protein
VEKLVAESLAKIGAVYLKNIGSGKEPILQVGVALVARTEPRPHYVVEITICPIRLDSQRWSRAVRMKGRATGGPFSKSLPQS